MSGRPRRFVLAARVGPRGVTAPPPDTTVRPPTPADTEALARLMHAAYAGTIDDKGETLDDTRAVVAQYFAGEFGPPMPSVSEVTERAGEPLAATLLTQWWGGPFVAFMITAPQAQRQGLARAGLTRALNRLAAGDEPWLRLVVTEGNARAETLYASLGFVPAPVPPFDGEAAQA
ncbi:GNAT family N-acetyltransferase [Rubrivivax rivuli]|uniref:GNAT family N-acetyltransferase n=1 Tax=Rubrivivax rivuli TaxID=1862385 RepID=UPI0013E3144E|nr:GNAT family N-acetyltransferase [Rubrivivax rivuli]